METAGVQKTTDKGKVDFHALRKAFVTWLQDSGTKVQDAQILARHSDIRLTLGIYTESWDEELNRAVDTLGEFLQKPSEENDEDETAS